MKTAEADSARVWLPAISHQHCSRRSVAVAASSHPLQILIMCRIILRQLKTDCHEHNSTFYILQVKSLQNNIDRADILEHSKA